MGRYLSLLLMILAACGAVQARPLSIVIVTSHDSAEDAYADFLEALYLDNADILIDDNRYQEPLNETEQQELLDADLVIVSSDNSGGDYNDDSPFWATLPVPVLCHSISVCRSNNHDNWDWFDGDQTTVSAAALQVTAPDDPLFDGVALDGDTLVLFDTPEDMDVSDMPYSGNGTVLAADASGLPMIVRFAGSEPNYYDGSRYGPAGSPRLFVALPDEPDTFFKNATPAALQLMRNALHSLLPECWLQGDIDCDRDVDLADFSELSAQWLSTGQMLAADIVTNGQVAIDDFALLAMHWLEGVDLMPPTPDPADWTDRPAVLDGGTVHMRAVDIDDETHGVQYFFECLEDAAFSSAWQYDRDYDPVDLPLGTALSFRVKARDTSSRYNETGFSSVRRIRTDGLFYHAADASAAAALDGTRFIMADDEDNILRVFDCNLPGSDPLVQTDVSTAIAVDPVHPESDIEGTTWFNGRLFWICSHGRSREGDYWPSRYRFFATTVAPDGTAAVDGVYAGLIDDLIQYDRVYNLGLEAAIGTVGDHIDPATIPNLAPKVDGLNIEGLSTTADGTRMLIGFRNPHPDVNGDRMALLIPLANPEAVVLHGAAPVLEPPILIDLNGLGIRSIEYSPALGEYLVAAGSHKGGEEEPVQYLYKVDLSADDKDRLATFSDITPEAIFQFPNDDAIHLLSDDGTLMIDTPLGPIMNKLLPRPERTYRTRTVYP